MMIIIKSLTSCFFHYDSIYSLPIDDDDCCGSICSLLVDGDGDHKNDQFHVFCHGVIYLLLVDDDHEHHKKLDFMFYCRGFDIGCNRRYPSS